MDSTAVLTIIKDTPVPTMLVIAGICFLVMAVITLKKPISLDLSSRNRNRAMWIGITALISGVVLNVLPTLLPASQPASTMETVVSTPAAYSSATFVPSLTPTLVPSPTSTAFLPTATAAPMPSPTSILGGGNCISANIWLPFKGASLPVNKDGCWQLDKRGMFAQGNLTLNLQDLPASKFYGIYTPLPYSCEIDFDINVITMTTINNNDGNIAFAVIPNERPTPNYGVELLLQVETSPPNYSPVKLKTHERNEMEQYIQHIPEYEFGRLYHFKLQVTATTLSIYLNSDLIAGPIGVPFAERSFWIGYSMPAGGNLLAIVSDFTIVEK